jgi:hypothetical protein
MVLVCVLLAQGIVRGFGQHRDDFIAVVACCLCLHIQAYRAEVDAKEVDAKELRVRYFPFYTRRTPIRDITHFVEERTLVLVTATSRIPLWGLSSEGRAPLLEILPHHLEVVPKYSKRRTDSVELIRRFARRTILAGIAFALTLGSVPFLKGGPGNNRVDSVGKYVWLLCPSLWLLFLFLAGMTWVFWSTKREVDELGKGRVNRPGRQSGGTIT